MSFQPKPTHTNKKFIPISQPRFPKGYISILTDSRIPQDALAKMDNMTLEQDSIPRPRPPFMPYGNAFLGTCVGMGTYTKIVAGLPEYHEISMQVINGGAIVCTRKDGGNWSEIRRPISAPGAPTATKTSGSDLGIGVYGYKVTFVSGGGETLPGSAGTVTTSSAQQDVNLTAIPTGPASVTARKIYRTKVGASTYFLLHTINDNSTTVYADTTPDASLPATTAPGSDTSTVSYSTTAWTTFTQGAQLASDGSEDNRVYISNGIDAMSYFDVGANDIVVYTGLATPTGLGVVASGGLTGADFNQYYRISANNDGGESAACANSAAGITTPRDFWISTMFCTVSWSAVSGATSYNIYTSDQSGQEAYLATVNGLTFVDTGALAVNVFKVAPNNDSSAGPTVTSLVNIDNALYGAGDPSNPQYLWYSGSGRHFGDFSFNPQGGGYVGIDYGGSTVPTIPFPFHDGKGNPAPSVLTHGAAGRGKLYHIQFTTTTIGTTTLTYPNVYEASAQDGTPSSRGVAIYNNSAYYCTGSAFKTTGTRPNVINILATDTISDQILPDVQNLNLAALSGMVALEFLGKVYFLVPTGGSAGNNEIWVLDLTRGGLWILRWTLATSGTLDHAWLYQDNSGITHMLLLQNNTVLELDLKRKYAPTQDNGTFFPTLLKSGAMVFDAGGVAEVASYFTYFKFLYPQGDIVMSVSGLNEDNANGLLQTAILTLRASASLIVWGNILYSNPNGSSVFSGDSGNSSNQVGPITVTTDASQTVPVEVDEIVSEETWQVTTNEAGCDYLLSSVTTTVYSIPRRYAGSA